MRIFKPKSNRMILVGVWANRNWILGNWIKEVQLRHPNNFKLWWVPSIYAGKRKFEKFISFSLDQILLESIEFDRVIYRSNEFKSIQSADDMSFRFALDCLSDKARPKINKVVASKFKIQIF